MAFIVVVDDSQANLKIYTRLLASVAAEAEVRAFTDPHLALDWLGTNIADLVVTDYKMPAMHGAEFTRRIRLLPSGADVPVVVVTAYADLDFRLEAFEAGASDFVQSPIDHSEFRMRARNLLKLGGHQRRIQERAQALEQELKLTEASREQMLRDSRERLAQVIDTIPAMVSATDTTGRCIFVNAGRATLLGPRAGQPGETIEPDRLDQLVLASGRPLPAFEESITLANGEVRTFLTTKSPLREGGERVAGVLSMSLDISERKRAETLLAFQAKHDYLTSLPNRSYLFHRLREELAAQERAGPELADTEPAGPSRGEPKRMALHFIDIDRFKNINDGLGHHIGDGLLQAVAARLQDAVRSGDMVARLGGDEFAVLQLGANSLSAVAQLAARLNELLRQPFVIDGREIVTSASIGVTIHPEDAAGPEELLRNADLAMYQIKTAGRNGFQFFTPDMLTRARDEIQLQAALRLALLRNEFELLYQPQVSLATGRIIGAEALIRWRRAGHGLVSPGEFLQVAAESGLMSEIDDWVLGEACRQARVWLDRLGRSLRVSVNVAALDARSARLSGRVSDALAAAGLPPSLLELELTEGVLMQDAYDAAADLEALHRLGVQLAIDDFGTGFSSLARLARLRVDKLKIDRSFIETLDEANSMAIVRAVVGLGRSLRIEVVAEGVETARQLEQIRAAGCDAVQGYFTGAPVSATDFARLLERDGSLAPMDAD